MKNIQSLEQILNSKKKKNSIWKEILIMLFLFTLTTIITVIGINFSTFKIFVADLISKNTSTKKDEIVVHIEKTLTSYKETNITKKNISIDNIKLPHTNKHEIKKLYLNQKYLSNYLKNKKTFYKLSFNILPPDNKIIISSLNIIAPIIDVKYATKEKIEKWDFDAELYKGVVKYPFTAYPGQTWNTLIFGHTSYYWWKKNPYGNIFAKIPKLKPGQTIQIIWNNKLYNYEIIEKKVIWPSQIENLYNQYKNWKYLTLMWCYPIWTDLRRILIIAKLKKDENLTFNK